MAADEAVEPVHLVDVLELVEGDEGAVAAALLEPKRQVEQRVQRRQRVEPGIDLQLRADPVGPEREADAGPLKKLLHLRAHRPLQVLRVGTLEADGHVRDRGDTVEIDENRDQTLPLFAVAQRPLQEARLAVLARREEPDIMAAHDVAKQLLRLRVAVDHVLGRERVRIDERIDVGDHRRLRDYRKDVHQTTRRSAGRQLRRPGIVSPAWRRSGRSTSS